MTLYNRKLLMILKCYHLLTGSESRSKAPKTYPLIPLFNTGTKVINLCLYLGLILLRKIYLDSLTPNLS